MSRAKLFKNGQSQAVRLPKEFRLPGSEVEVSRFDGGVLLKPIPNNFDDLFQSLELFSDDYLEDGRKQPDMPKREDLF